MVGDMGRDGGTLMRCECEHAHHFDGVSGDDEPVPLGPESHPYGSDMPAVLPTKKTTYGTFKAMCRVQGLGTHGGRVLGL